MQPELNPASRRQSSARDILDNPHESTGGYAPAEAQFTALLQTENLDALARRPSSAVRDFESTLAEALDRAYGQPSTDRGAVHLFLQRTLYRIYRLNLFWYDDLARYANERSVWLHRVRDRIEAAWQPWERAQFEVPAFGDATDVSAALTERAAVDLDPPLSADDGFYREEMTLVGYRRLLAIASLDGLVEASQLSRILGGASNPVHAKLTRLLLEEYGFGHLERKHSSHFAEMLREAGMRTEPEAYFQLVPWEVLALSNQSFLFSERRRYFLRYIGGLLFFETAVPAAFRHYRAAARRLGVSQAGSSYWDLHIHADQRHGRWMLDDVALPLADRYPRDAWEMVLGYDQQRTMSARAGKAVVRAIREVQQQSAPLP